MYEKSWLHCRADSHSSRLKTGIVKFHQASVGMRIRIRRLRADTPSSWGIGTSAFAAKPPTNSRHSHAPAQPSRDRSTPMTSVGAEAIGRDAMRSAPIIPNLSIDGYSQEVPECR
jgi:hypothetical protein